MSPGVEQSRRILDPKPTLLIVTDRNDFAADFVIVRLRERGLIYYRLNSDELGASEVTVRVGGGQEQQRQIACQGAAVSLDNVRAVWYRRAIRPQVAESVDPAFRVFAAAELRQLFEGLISDPTVRWVNPLYETERAERKLYQLRIAEQHGLRIPATIVSRDRCELARFVADHREVICKPISQGFIRSGDTSYAVHTHRITEREILEAATVGTVPTLLQQCIPRGTDVRVTLIGDAVFPVEILVPADAPVDWRATREGLRYRMCTLPPETERACRSLMRALGLLYGAFDFIRTDRAEWFFLEVNPAGEWAWLDVELGLSMRDKLIDVLYGND